MGRLHKYPFILHNFVTGKHDVELVLPETWQAKDLFDQLQKNLVEFSKWLVWVNKIDSVQKEVDSIKQFQQKMIDGTAFNLVILVNKIPAGMIDLHYLNSESGEVGYWLSNDFQHLGIMTESVEFLKKYAFEQLGLKYLILRTHPQNFASQNVAKRSGFEYQGIDDNDHKKFILKK
ncbi:acetyltransferase, GNAT family [Lactobacillus paragasseri JV-V03]|uniref:Acetyltransferase, GNAT family n=1 Tax=Lactobacillus paragasseri JV-V03 TaxID=525326 RepID=A0AA87DMG5_9LACO|nr:acetyltransferase, GNAT family [Lactobacillus paragasseri JV-V03]